MELLPETSDGYWPKVHEYPDPDYAAYVTKYPWTAEQDDYIQPEPLDEPGGSWYGDHQPGSESDHSAVGDDDVEKHVLESTIFHTGKELRFDPDYLTSDGTASEDDIISDGGSADSIEDFGPANTSLGSGNIHQRRGSGMRRSRVRGSRGRNSRGRLGRGGKGIKRGLRKAIEPTEEFKALHSQATIAFIDQNYDEAELLTLQAIRINPEMYPAHNLLSEIHAVRGDNDKAISAAWAGAHTNHRDPQIWSRCARLILDRESNDRKLTLRDAIYCINRILNLDKRNVVARYQRASLYHELGHKGRAAMEYEELFRQLPHDTTVLRHLAEIYIELEKPELALEHYESTIFHFQATQPDEVSSFSWSDVNIVTELYGFQERYEEGIVQLKSLSRWLLGRGEQVYWEAIIEDDREWDLDDQPRRIQLPEFTQGSFDSSWYGNGLPLELRVKLGIFRLKAQRQDLEEAASHFEWLEPEENDMGAKLYDYPDLFREAANALRRADYFEEAIRYYEPLQQVSDYVDVSYLFELASCYKAIGLTDEAEDCYKTIVEQDDGNYEAHLQLIGLRPMPEADALENMGGRQGASIKHHKSKTRTGNKHSQRLRKLAASPPLSTLMLLPPRPLNETTKKLAAEQVQLQEEKLQSLFHHRQSLSQKAPREDGGSKNEWVAATETLLQGFQENKVFYPFDRHHKFYGYSKEARVMASRPKYEVEALVKRSESMYETPDGNHIMVPDNYCGITFEAWLDVFLEYALAAALEGDLDLAYDTISSAIHANVFYHSPQSLFLAHVCWFTCALIGNDDETLCDVARWFMKEYQFISDGYRLFSALNKLCDSENSWYNCGPSQKYILRQLKAVDFTLLGDIRKKGVSQDRASYSTRGSGGHQLQADDMDVTLLMLYGHVLHAGKSYPYAINYYLRALALDPTNPMIKLSLALGYVHHALRRLSENRHHTLMQGFAFLVEYYEDRSRSASCSEQQEAEYNVAHVYHLLGLTHLAAPYYERCLHLSLAVQAESLDHQAEDFRLEAVANLQSFWAASGNMEKAREVTERWMIV